MNEKLMEMFKSRDSLLDLSKMIEKEQIKKVKNGKVSLTPVVNEGWTDEIPEGILQLEFVVKTIYDDEISGRIYLSGRPNSYREQRVNAEVRSFGINRAVDSKTVEEVEEFLFNLVNLNQIEVNEKTRKELAKSDVLYLGRKLHINSENPIEVLEELKRIIE